MSIIDFESFKKAKEIDCQFEKDYSKFLSHINKFIDTPKTLPKIVEVFYYFCRYLGGTVNSIMILTTLNLLKYEDVQQLKKLTIEWLKDLISKLEEI